MKVQRRIDIGRLNNKLEESFVVFIFGKWITSDFMLLYGNYIVCGLVVGSKTIFESLVFS